MTVSTSDFDELMMLRLEKFAGEITPMLRAVASAALGRVYKPRFDECYPEIMTNTPDETARAYAADLMFIGMNHPVRRIIKSKAARDVLWQFICCELKLSNDIATMSREVIRVVRYLAEIMPDDGDGEVFSLDQVITYCAMMKCAETNDLPAYYDVLAEQTSQTPRS